MDRFTSPLDDLRVASPCPANWDEMYGNERKRFCSECKLNVYNLSNMTKREAEQFLINSERRVCVRFYRRADGTVLTQNCPVGWQAVKRRVSRVTTAAFSVIVGFFSGLFAFNLFKEEPPVTMGTIAFTDPIVQGKPAMPIKRDEWVNGEPMQGGISAPEYEVGMRVTPAPNSKKNLKRK